LTSATETVCPVVPDEDPEEELPPPQAARARAHAEASTKSAEYVRKVVMLRATARSRRGMLRRG
jgi:hypothetical protein